MGGLAVGGVIVDYSVIKIHDDDADDAYGNGIPPSALSLLLKLRRSNLRTAISFAPSLPADEVALLKRMATENSHDCFVLNASSIHDSAKEITIAWGDIGGSILYLVSNISQDTFNQLSYLGWLVVVMEVDGAVASKNSSMLCINKLEELFLTICCLNKKAIGDNVVTVGYIMKPSREHDFAKRGAFPVYPTPNGLMFLPLTFELSLPSQLQHVDIVLHKATDEIVSVELSGSSESSNIITYTKGMQELQRHMEHDLDCFAIDPLDKIYPVLDRLKIQQILIGLEDLNTKGHPTIRGPHFLKVNDFNEPGLVQRLSDAKLSLPSIVKPQVACGVADAHSMAIIFRVGDFKDLSVPLPAIIQEYIDHSSTLFKIYVLGEKVFYAVKKSTPNADALMKLSEGNGFGPLIFDSLKSLPTGSKHSRDDDSSKANSHCFDFELVTDAANWLARKLDLTIFGFDVVVQEATSDHVIVDVNYLPSFKELPDNVAIPAFWDALRQKFDSRKMK